MANGPRIEELIDLIRSFCEQFSRGNARLTAHFIVNDAIPQDTIYIIHLPKLGLISPLLGRSSAIDEDKDYGVVVHPESLQVIRAEVNKNTPIPLNDNEIAYILAVAALDGKQPEPPKLRHYGINTDIS